MWATRGYDSDADEAVHLINEKPFMSRALQASAAPQLDRVLITNLQQDVDEDRLVLHLEQRKVTLVDDVEVSVEELDDSNHSAIVVFTDPSGTFICVSCPAFYIFCVIAVRCKYFACCSAVLVGFRTCSVPGSHPTHGNSVWRLK